MNILAEKRCRGCGRTLALDEFWNSRVGKGGKNPRCQDCCKAKAKALRLAKPPSEEKRLADAERTREWIKANKERQRQGIRTYRRRHPERVYAGNEIRRAVREGRVEKLPCEVCGTTEDVQAHHNDYSKPLEVRWLCRTHHGQAHRKELANA